jgi:hypothetical protein
VGSVCAGALGYATVVALVFPADQASSAAVLPEATQLGPDSNEHIATLPSDAQIRAGRVRALGGTGSQTQVLAHERQIAAAQLEALEAAFERERADPDWSTPTERLVSASVEAGELPAGLRVVSVNCRATLCIGEFEHELAHDMGLLSRLLGFAELPRWFIRRQGPDPDGRYHTTVYLARAGYSLPDHQTTE